MKNIENSPETLMLMSLYCTEMAYINDRNDQISSEAIHML